MDEIEIGSKAPTFQSIDQDGDEFLSQDLKGTAYVLYFYPKDETLGCTTEACSFRDNLEDLELEGVTVVGVSPDSAESHRHFKKKHDLNFTLLSDPKFELCRKFDVLRDHNKVERSTFLIDEDGLIQWIEQPVDVEGHVDRIFEALEVLND